MTPPEKAARKYAEVRVARIEKAGRMKGRFCVRAKVAGGSRKGKNGGILAPIRMFGCFKSEEKAKAKAKSLVSKK